MTDWVAACMEPDEWRLWTQANHRLRNSGYGGAVARPCEECPLGFALEMRAINRCNGEPSGAPDEEEDEPMEVARVSAQRVSVQVHAPCPTCLHRDVCAIKQDVDGAGNAEVGLRQLSPALTPRVTVHLDCAFYLRDKAAGKAPNSDVSEERVKRKLNLTPEQRANLAERAAKARAVLAEKRASEAA